ncbi:cation diffusion zinc membrane transporter Zrg17 [Savitreella phatthalungensis]
MDPSTPIQVAGSSRLLRPSSVVFDKQSREAVEPRSVSPVRPQRRRGHHHKHSLSHQFFLPPVDRAPLSLPASLPLPTLGELVAETSVDQKLQLGWACIHLALSFALWHVNSSSLAAFAVSKCVAVEALSLVSSGVFGVWDNFDVWRGSSVSRAFGLRRTEVVTAFVLAVYIVYGAIELVRELLERLLVGGSHAHGHTDAVHIDPHALSGDLMGVSMVICLLATAFATAAFGRSTLTKLLAVDVPYVPIPFALLSGVPAAILATISFVGPHLHAFGDRLLAGVIAAAMAYTGGKLVFRLACILLLTYPVDEVQELYAQIEQDDAVARALPGQTQHDLAPVQGQVWQCWVDLVVVALRVRVKGGETQEQQFRERCRRYVKEILGGGYGGGSDVKFHIAIECVRV